MATLTSEALYALNGTVHTMRDVRELVTLYDYMSIRNPYWHLSENCNILHFSIDEAAEVKQTIELSPEQADRIHKVTVITSNLLTALPIEDDGIPVHLIGRKINKHEWAGSTSAWGDTPSVAHNLTQGLSSAE